MAFGIVNEGAYEAARHGRILANARKTFCKNFERAEEVIQFLRGFYEEGKTGFLAEMADNLFGKYGKLTQKQYDTVCNTIDTWAERRAAKEAAIAEQKARSAFLGVVAERVNMTLVVEKILEIPATKFSYYDSATQCLYLMRDEAGNRIILKTKTDVLVECDEGADRYFIKDDGKSYRNVMEGDTIEVAATIKAHVEYKGEKQTLIQRVKVKRIILEKEAA